MASTGKKPPAAQNAALHFMDLSHEYLLLVPKPAKNLRAPAFGPDSSRLERVSIRQIAFAVSMQRKFVHCSEGAYIPQTLEAVLNDLGSSLPEDHRCRLRDLRDRIKPLFDYIARDHADDGYNHEDMEYSSGLSFEEQRGSMRNANVLYRKFFYGRLIHGDYSKWIRRELWWPAYLEISRGISKVETLIIETRHLLGTFMEEGLLPVSEYIGDVDRDTKLPEGGLAP
ncbi:hypothetical protein [uncultured Kocuria sp.]|uniref:hypothetical protein n=1 Tax=uncultured Kocuria sp. TaxID=259305 RepID=UPI002596AA17|nr:hypothetical protein [uncultured Kocuria sp.]MCT1368362.1 hypothetical protein [Rothia sp. p3-SID1597]